ncbi:MAG: hypothetical protein WBZ36_23600 [Candidatus Nitrosopolaris sp.]|jgi:hypothetical protein
MIITATSNKALTMIGVCVVFSLITGASIITQPASGSNGGKIPCIHPSSGTYKSHNNDMSTKQNDDDNDYGAQSYFGQQNYVPQPFSALEPNWENIACIHPSSGTYKSHNNDMSTKQNDDYGAQSYFGQQIFRNVPYGSPFPFRNVPYGSPFPFRNVPFGLPFSNDYGTQPYFAQHKFRNDPFELPFP